MDQYNIHNISCHDEYLTAYVNIKARNADSNKNNYSIQSLSDKIKVSTQAKSFEEHLQQKNFLGEQKRKVSELTKIKCLSNKDATTEI